MEQLMALGVGPGDPDSAAKAFTDLKRCGGERESCPKRNAD
jgi:hypothetical protein